MANIVDIEFKFPPWNQRLRANMHKVQLTIAAAMQTNRGELFDHEGAANGHKKWESLKFRNGQIMSMRGDLRKSIAPPYADGKPGSGGIVRFNGNITTIGSSLIMARLLNKGTAAMPGGVLKPKHAQALKIPLPAGKRATTLAKELRKGATSGKELLARLSEIKQDIATTKNPARRAKLREHLAKMEKKSRGMKSSDRFLFLKSVKIPARNFDDITSEDAKEIEETMMNKILEVLSG